MEMALFAVPNDAHMHEHNHVIKMKTWSELHAGGDDKTVSSSGRKIQTRHATKQHFSVKDRVCRIG